MWLIYMQIAHCIATSAQSDILIFFQRNFDGELSNNSFNFFFSRTRIFNNTDHPAVSTGAFASCRYLLYFTPSMTAVVFFSIHWTGYCNRHPCVCDGLIDLIWCFDILEWKKKASILEGSISECVIWFLCAFFFSLLFFFWYFHFYLTAVNDLSNNSGVRFFFCVHLTSIIVLCSLA